MREFLKTIYGESMRPFEAVLVWLYILGAVGFAIDRDDPSGDMRLLFAAMHWTGWAVVALIMSGMRLAILVLDKTPMWAKKTVAILGVVFWSMLFASNLANPVNLAFGLMFAVLSMIEGWIFSRAASE